MTSVSTEIYEATRKFTCFYSKGARREEILVRWMFLPNGCLKFNVNEALETQYLQVLGQRFMIGTVLYRSSPTGIRDSNEVVVLGITEEIRSLRAFY